MLVEYLDLQVLLSRLHGGEQFADLDQSCISSELAARPGVHPIHPSPPVWTVLLSRLHGGEQQKRNGLHAFTF